MPEELAPEAGLATSTFYCLSVSQDGSRHRSVTGTHGRAWWRWWGGGVGRGLGLVIPTAGPPPPPFSLVILPLVFTEHVLGAGHEAGHAAGTKDTWVDVA